MPVMPARPAVLVLLGALAAQTPASLSAQQQDSPDPAPSAPSTIVVRGAPEMPEMAEGPEIRGVIAARSGQRLKVIAADGTSTVILVNDSTRITASGGLFGSNRSALRADALLNGLPVTVKTARAGDALVAKQISFRNTDLKTATMIRNGTAQRFDEQAAATEALRGRMGDIDKYNIKSTTNVYFDSGKAVLSDRARADLCAAAATAGATDNALMLVVGYTDSTGSDELNQKLSEKRAAGVINHLQQVCGWKPYRMLAPTGMAKADPLASNSTPEGKAQNRRVSVNVLVSKALDGM